MLENNIFYDTKIILLLDLTPEEKSELNQIDDFFSPLLKKTFKEYQENVNLESVKILENKYNTIFREYIAKKNGILEKAYARELDYFAKNPEELFSKLKSYIKKDILSISKGEKTVDKSLETLYETTNHDKNDEIRKYIFVNGLLYHAITLLQGNKELYYELLQFTENCIKQNKKETVTKKIRTSRTDELLVDRSKINKKIREERKEFYNGGIDVKTGEIGKSKKPVYTPVALNYVTEELEKQGLTVDGVGILKPFDMIILTHVESLYEAGNQIMTADMIATQMNGGRRIQATPKLKAQIYNSLMRLRLINITINTQNEFDVRYNPKTIFSGVILPNKIEGEPIMLNGKKIMEYIYVLDNSPLTKYSKSKNQISRPPVNMLDVPVSLTQENIILTDYLSRRIIDMQSPEPKKGKYIILYETIFDYLKIEDENPNTLKVTKKRIREDVRAILKEWKKNGFILDFEELGEDDKPPKTRAPIVKIKISIPPKQNQILDC